jgi:hypothetical protein
MMEREDDYTVDRLVIVKRDDHNGDRIPVAYRLYIADKTYIYKARIVNICPGKRYCRVQPLPSDESFAPFFTRKGYKSKLYKMPL